MKIVHIETLRTDDFPNLIYVQVHTDGGLVGLGETFYGAEAVEAHIHSVFAPALLGEDPLRIRHHQTQLAGYTGYAGSGAETRARSALDLALWDLLGKAAGQPVYNLLGGATREYVAIYNTCAGTRYVNAAQGQSVANWGVQEGSYEDLYAAIHHPGRLARELVDSGIGGMKIWPFDEYAESSGGNYISSRDLARATSKVAQIRDAVGDTIEIMVELHALWDVPSAQKIVRALEPFEPMWVEDPVRSDVIGGLARVAQDTPLRIAGGETTAGLAAFQALLSQNALGVVTVDTTWTGGLTIARDIAALAAAHGVPVAPHDCTGPVALSACVHLAMAAPNILIQETVRAGYLGWYPSLTQGGPVIKDGTIRASENSGLGISLLPDLWDRPGTKSRSSRLDD